MENNNINFKLPNLGLEEVEVIEILVKENNKINLNDVLLIVESNKTTIEIQSNITGKINKIFIKLGDKIKFGDILFEISTLDKSILNKSINNFYYVFLININFEIYINKIFVKINDFINIDQEILELLYNNKKYIIKSNFEGTIKKILVKEKEFIYSDTKIFSIDFIKFNNNIKISNNIINIDFNNYIKKDINNIYSSPSVRRISNEYNIDLNKIKGSGNKNRILKEDLYNYLLENNILNENKDLKNKNLDNYEKKYNDLYFKKFGNIKETYINNINKISGERLYYSWITIPHVTNFDDIDITDTYNFIKNYNNECRLNNINIKISLLSLIIKSISCSLKKFELFNSSFIKNDNKLIIKEYINIGFAVDTEFGLIVPVIKDVCNKNISSISIELLELTKKCRSKKYNSNDVTGGTFTISSLGSIGDCKYFTPIINYPEVAILGISKFYMNKIFLNNEFTSKLILPISLSYDHRVINGAYAVKFINYFKKLLQDCRRILL